MSTNKQLPGKINGGNPLVYTGSTPNMLLSTRRPTTKDYIPYEIGTWWIIPKTQDGSTPSSEVWVLVSKALNVGTWKRLRGGGSPSNVAGTKVTVIDTPGAGTYTPTDGMVQVQVECVGGGGGGNSAGAGTWSARGGDGGGYCRKLFTAAQIGTSQAYVVGDGGAADTRGQDTTFGSLLTAGGGSAFGDAGGTTTGGDINIPGGPAAINDTQSQGSVGDQATPNGGNSFMGFGGRGSQSVSVAVAGNNGQVYGGGGSSAAGFLGSGTSAAGGAGAAGVIIITEYLE